MTIRGRIRRGPFSRKVTIRARATGDFVTLVSSDGTEMRARRDEVRALIDGADRTWPAFFDEGQLAPTFTSPRGRWDSWPEAIARTAVDEPISLCVAGDEVVYDLPDVFELVEVRGGERARAHVCQRTPDAVAMGSQPTLCVDQDAGVIIFANARVWGAA